MGRAEHHASLELHRAVGQQGATEGDIVPQSCEHTSTARAQRASLGEAGLNPWLVR